MFWRYNKTKMVVQLFSCAPSWTEAALQGLSLGSTHCTVHGRLHRHLRRTSIYSPVKVYGGDSWPFCLRQQFITIMWKSPMPSPCCKMIKTLTLRKSGGNNATCDTLLQTFSYTVSVALIPMYVPPSFCPLPPYSKQQKAGWGPEKEATQSTLWLLSPRKSCIPTWSTRVSQQLQLIKPYKFSCKSGLFLPSHPPHCTKQKYYTQYKKKVAYK